PSRCARSDPATSDVRRSRTPGAAPNTRQPERRWAVTDVTALLIQKAPAREPRLSFRQAECGDAATTDCSMARAASTVSSERSLSAALCALTHRPSNRASALLDKGWLVICRGVAAPF